MMLGRIEFLWDLLLMIVEYLQRHGNKDFSNLGSPPDCVFFTTTDSN